MAKTKTIDASIGVDSLLENGFFYLEEHKWKLAKQYFEKVIEINPRNPYAYIGKLLVTHKLPNIDSLPDCPIDFRNSNCFKTALKYADNQLKKQLENYIDQYKAKVDEQYIKAIDDLSKAQTIEEYKICYKTFVSFGDYKEAKQYAEKAKEFITEYNYNLCVDNIGSPMGKYDYLKYMRLLENMNFRDSLKLYASYEEMYNKELIYSEVCSKITYAESIGEYKEIIEKLKIIGDYKNSYELLQECENKLKHKKGANNALIYITIALVVLFGIIFKNSMLLYVISMIICLGGGVFVSWMIGTDKDTVLTHLGISLLIAFLFGLIIVLICTLGSGDSRIGETCGACGGDGYFFGKQCSSCHGFGIYVD